MNEKQKLIDIENLSVRFGSGKSSVDAVQNISFDILKGETLALVGESGSGKSVTAHSILKLLPYPHASHPTGEIHFNDTEIITASEQRMRAIRGNDIAMIFQEPQSALNPLHSIERQIAESLRLHQGLRESLIRNKVIELLDKVGIKDPESRLASYPHQLSGGQRQRVMIAMALANRPKLLIADEPTTALDVTIQAQILALLNQLKHEFDMSILLITHDLGLVRHMADRVNVMRYGKIVECQETKTLFSTPKHSYTKMLINAEPKGQAEAVAANAKEILSAKDMKVWFPIKRGFFKRTIGHVKAVDGVSIALHEGETIGIVGESGSGKTTLGMALLRLIESKGDISFQGHQISQFKRKDMRDLRTQIQVVFQDPFASLSPRLLVEDIIAEGLDVHQKNMDYNSREKAIIGALQEVGLDPNVRFRYPHEFSGGQRQRIAIARALILKPKLVILDEPTSALDMSVQTQIIDLLQSLQKKYGLAYLFISHDLKVVRALSNKVMVMQAGKIVESASVEEIFKAPKQEYTKTLIAAAFDHVAVSKSFN